MRVRIHAHTHILPQAMSRKVEDAKLRKIGQTPSTRKTARNARKKKHTIAPATSIAMLTKAEEANMKKTDPAPATQHTVTNSLFKKLKTAAGTAIAMSKGFQSRLPFSQTSLLAY